MGGRWNGKQNKVLPGVYTDVVGDGNVPSVYGNRGIVALPIILPFLEEDAVITVTSENIYDFIGKYDGYTVALEECFKYATKVLLYRLNTGTRATANIGNIVCNAKYTGSFGNRLSVSIQNVYDSDKIEVITWLDTVKANVQSVDSLSEIVSNAYIDFIVPKEITSVEDNAGTTLVGGDDGVVTNNNYVNFLKKIETYEFNAIACPIDEIAVKKLYVAFVKRLRDDGKYIQGVLPSIATADSEGIISVANGVYLEGGVHITKEIATAYIAGATASIELEKSLTNAPYQGAIDVDVRYTISEREELVRNGQMAFVPTSLGSNKVMIEKDINTVVAFTKERPYSFCKNKIIRIVDDICTTIYMRGTLYYIGKVQNNQQGRDMFRKDILNEFRKLEKRGVIRDVVPEDIVVEQGELLDSIVVSYIVRPVDTIDIIYNSITVVG